MPKRAVGMWPIISAATADIADVQRLNCAP